MTEVIQTCKQEYLNDKVIRETAYKTAKARNYAKGWNDCNDAWIKALSEYTRPHGRWEYNQYDANPNIGNWHCSVCRHIIIGSYKQKPADNFCSNCGADMREITQDYTSIVCGECVLGDCDSCEDLRGDTE